MKNKIVIGTAGLGMEYGLPGYLRKPPSIQEAVDFISRAYDLGFKVFDSSPVYGNAEVKLGKALGDKGAVWTKCGGFWTEFEDVLGEVKGSFNSLSRKNIDILQWHQWTHDLIHNDKFRLISDVILEDKRIKSFGASTYGTENAVAAVNSGFFSFIQVEWNLLNQKVLQSVLSHTNKDVKIAIRSIFLRGLLTSRGSKNLIGGLKAFEKPIKKARAVAEAHGLTLEELSLVSSLLQPTDYVIVGISTIEHLEWLNNLLNRDIDQYKDIKIKDLNFDSNLIDPRNWENGEK